MSSTRTGQRSRSRVRSRALGALLIVAAAACGPPADPLRHATPSRHQAPPPDLLTLRDPSPTLRLVPGAAYLQGPGVEGARRGDWFAAYPDPRRWPADEARPVLALGRVVEASDAWSRLELLAVTDSTRTPTLEPARVEAGEVAWVTKRLLPVRGEGGEARVSLGTAGWITGAEVYGVIPARALDSPAWRMGAQVTGLVRLIPQGPLDSQVAPLIGAAPRPGDALVLLGARDPAPLPLEVLIARVAPTHPAAGAEAALGVRVEAELAAQGLGDVPVQVVADVIGDEASARALLDGRDPARLSVLVWATSDDATGDVTDDAQRVTLTYSSTGGRVLLDAPYRVAVATALDDADAAWLATALGAHLHQLRGQHAAAALALERALVARVARDPAAAWAALAPWLTDAYLRLRRHDWALEVHLALEALDAPGEARLGEARLRSALILRDLDRVEAAIAALPDDPEALTTPALEALVSFHLDLGREAAAAAWLEALIARQAAALDRALDLRVALLRARLAGARGEGARAEAQLTAARALAATLGALEALEVERVALRVTPRADAQRALDDLDALVTRANALGAPALIHDALRRAASRHEASRPDLSARLWRLAAWSAQAARRPALLADALARHEALRRDHPEAVTDALPPALQEAYVMALATLDRRAELGVHTLDRARQAASLDEGRDLLQLASELFLSVGDPLNLAVAELSRARLELEAGDLSLAAHHLQRARRFETLAGVEALTDLRLSIERDLATQRAAP